MLTPQERGRRYEKKVSKELGYKTQPGSGNTWSKKGDSRRPSGKFLMEIKYTDAEVYKFKDKDWQKHERHAMNYGQIPVFLINFQGKYEVAVLEEVHYLSILPEDMSQFIIVLRLAPKGTESYGLKLTDVKQMKYNQDFSQTYPLVFAGKSFRIMQRQEFEDLKSDYEAV